MILQKLVLPVCFIIALPGTVAPDVYTLQNTEAHVNTINIGLLVPDNSSHAAKNGAEMAILKANAGGGYKGKPFRLVVRSMEGPWGTGSKEAVSLIFDENVCAILGSHDGRNAHLVEQVATKTRIICLSAWAGDPTLSEAFVPWFFSCVPNDLAQADALIEEIYNKRKINKTVAISDNSYDSKLALENFVKRARLAGKNSPLQLFCDNTIGDFGMLLDQISKSDAGGIIMFTAPSASAGIIQQLHQRKINLPVFGTLALLDDDETAGLDMKYYENVVIISSAYPSGSKNLIFRKEYQKNYGILPGPVAEYSFDGMNLLIEAIKNAGTDRVKIQNYLSKIHYDGVTGEIQFDDKGKRIGIPGVIEIKNGVPVTVER
jgi:branched-chain amino acid transport system substrate-binding protein